MTLRTVTIGTALVTCLGAGVVADFELSGVTESEKAGWAKIVFWGYNVNKGSSARGKQTSAEACAKHLKEQIEKGK